MSHLILGIIIGAVVVAGYIYRKLIIAKAEAEFNAAHAWVLANGNYNHKIVNEVEHIWTVTQGEVKGIGASLVKALADLKAKL